MKSIVVTCAPPAHVAAGFLDPSFSVPLSTLSFSLFGHSSLAQVCGLLRLGSDLDGQYLRSAQAPRPQPHHPQE